MISRIPHRLGVYVAALPKFREAKMKFLLVLLMGFSPSLTLAFLCDDTYHLQSINQTLLVGSDPKNLVKTSKLIKPDLSNFDVISLSLNYKIISRFEGACSKAVMPITFKHKASGKSAFTDTVDNSFNNQMYDTNTLIEKYKYDYWFGFYQPKDKLIAYLGRQNIQSEAFTNFYAAVFMIDSVRDAVGGGWTVSPRSIGPSGPADSGSLDQALLAGIRNMTFDANHRSYFTVQFLEVKYENKPAPVALAQTRRSATHFQVSQTGNLVLIKPNEKSPMPHESVSLYGMMGNKVATLHPTGYVYQWNGRTSLGAEASPGVYFVQSGEKILGKFFYSR